VYNAYYTKHQRNFAHSEHGKALVTVFDDAATGQNGGLVQCLSQSHYKEMTMFDMTLPQNLGVLAIQHEAVPVDALQSVGQEDGNGPWPPTKLAMAVQADTYNLTSEHGAGGGLPAPSVGQEDGNGPWPPKK
jgi:hypothetical protein